MNTHKQVINSRKIFFHLASYIKKKNKLAFNEIDQLVTMYELKLNVNK